MNGYQLLSESYRSLARKGEISSEVAEQEARIFDFLATCDEDDIYRLVDSSAFNEIIKAYIYEATKLVNMDDKTRKELMQAVHTNFDFLSAREVMKRYQS